MTSSCGELAGGGLWSWHPILLFIYFRRKKTEVTEKGRDYPRNTWQVRIMDWVLDKTQVSNFTLEAFYHLSLISLSAWTDEQTIRWEDRQMNKIAI